MGLPREFEYDSGYAGQGSLPNLRHPALAQTESAVDDDGRTPRFVMVMDLFKGRHFDREIVVRASAGT